jgi:hypothetical protein
MPPDPEADVRWACRWFSFFLSKSCAPPPTGILQREPFLKFCRRVLVTTFNSQGFSDLMLGHISLILREHQGNSRRLAHFGLLLGTKAFPRVDDGSVDLGEDTMQLEWCCVAVSLCNMLSSDPSKPMLPSEEDSAVPIGHALMVVPTLMKRMQISPTGIAAVKKILSEEAKESMHDTVMYNSILDAVKDEWLSQFGRRSMQSSARYSMATKEVNMFDALEAVKLISRQEKLSNADAVGTYMGALELMRKSAVITAVKSNVTRSPNVDERQFIGSILRARWLLTTAEPRWLQIPEEAQKTDEQDLFLINESWLTMKRRMTDILNKCENQGTLRKLAVRMRIELADAMQSIDDPDEDEIVDESMQAEDRQRMWTLLSTIGATTVNQDDSRKKK